MNEIPFTVEQLQVVHAESKLSVVLGGAGTGKTTSALAAAQAYLHQPATPSIDRVLFLSFSRASVARIVDRSLGILGPAAGRVEVLTFHALAYSIVRRFGSLIGRPDAVLVSPPRERLGRQPGSIGYGDLLPLALQILGAAPAVAAMLRQRWGLIIVDEFQDTGDLQQDLLDVIGVDARMILLGDPDQCIFTFLAQDGVRLERIHEACERAGAANTIELPDLSHRDPTGVIPAVARAIQRRQFNSPALTQAIDEGRLEVKARIPLSQETEEVARLVADLRNEGLGVAVFTHHNDMLAALSDGLERALIPHEIAGLGDALACALDAQAVMMRFAAGGDEWSGVLDAVAVFITSAQRGGKVPQLARDVLDGTGSSTLQDRLLALRDKLDSAEDSDDARHVAASAHNELGLPSKSGAWEQAAALLGPMHARARRELGREAEFTALVAHICSAAREATYSALTDLTVAPQEIQLMNLYQTKGREADATVVVLREGDWLGKETEPFPATSRLLYVVFSRARKRIIVMLVGDRLHPAVAPLAGLFN